MTTELRQIKPSELTPHPHNSRVHDAQNVAEIAESIKAFGFVRPIVADESLTVLIGHGALAAALSLELATVPVVVTNGMTDPQKRAYLIADNRLAERSRWDWEQLDLELKELGELGIELPVMGFEQWSPDIRGKPGREVDQRELEFEHKCPKCGFEFD